MQLEIENGLILVQRYSYGTMNVSLPRRLVSTQYLLPRGSRRAKTARKIAEHGPPNDIIDMAKELDNGAIVMPGIQ